MTGLSDIIWPEKSKAPNSQEQLALERIRRDHECLECGGMLRLDWDGRIYCWKDAAHEGTRKARRSQKPYGLPGNRADER